MDYAISTQSDTWIFFFLEVGTHTEKERDRGERQGLSEGITVKSLLDQSHPADFTTVPQLGKTQSAEPAEAHTGQSSVVSLQLPVN